MYIFSGLGADERVFKYLDFKDLDVTFVQWVKPLPNEQLIAYTKRINVQITDENPILIGLSFGGIVATELSKIIPIEKLILISSLKTQAEIPFIYRLAGKLNLHRIISYSILKKDHSLNRWLFGIIRKNDRNLFKKVLADTDIDFLKWAIDCIVKWNNMTIHPSLFHILELKINFFQLTSLGK